MPDYSKSKVYKIVCNITGDTYYGSTTQSLSRRLAEHKCGTKRSNPLYSKQIIDRGNYAIILCEECPCDNKEQLHALERKWIEDNECINKCIPGRTRAEYRQTNKEALAIKSAEYRQGNKEALAIKKTEYYRANKEAIAIKKAEWQQANKEALAIKQAEYYRANKEALAIKKAERYRAKKANQYPSNIPA